jgi:hypothetical protein
VSINTINISWSKEYKKSNKKKLFNSALEKNTWTN